MTECTSMDCGMDATLYLCPQCIRDLQAWLDKIPELLDDLFITMAKLDKTAPQNREGGGGLSTGSAMPLNYGALEKRQALGLWVNTTAENLAKDQYAGNFLPMLKQLIESSLDLIDNPPETRVITTCNCGGKVTTTNPKPEDDKPDSGRCEDCDEYYEQSEAMTRFRINRATPEDLTTRHALKWIRDNANLSIKPDDVRNWAREQKLEPTNPERGKHDHPTYNVADILKIHYRHVSKNKRATNF